MKDPLGPLLRRLISLAAPVAIGRLGIVGMGVVDTIVVGQLAPSEVAHQALGWTVNGPALIGGIGLLLGVQVLAARAVGEGRKEAAGAIWRRGLVIAGLTRALISLFVWTLGARLLIAAGIPREVASAGAAVAAVLAIAIAPHLAFMASTKFLEALERPTPGAIAMWLANAVNLGLDLAFVPSGGAIGSAWATVCARVFLAGVIAVYIVTSPRLRPHLVRSVSRVEDGYRALLSIGAAAAFSGLVEAAGFATLGVIAARAAGETGIAAFSIATGGLVTLVYLLAQGFATAGVVLVSEAIGRGEIAEATRVGWSATLLTVVAMAICGVGCALFATEVAHAFTSNAAIAAALVAIMIPISVLMISDGGQGVADGLLRAHGVNWFPTFVRLVAFVGVAPALALWLGEVEGGGLRGVVSALLIASTAAFLALVARLTLLHSAPSDGSRREFSLR